MATIEVDFDVYKELTWLRTSEEETYSDVIRTLLRGVTLADEPTSPEAPFTERSGGWFVKGIFIPNGTELRAHYKGRVYTGLVKGNGLTMDGQMYHTPSAAAHAITDTNLNGWGFWEGKRPGDSEWQKIWKWRSE